MKALVVYYSRTGNTRDVAQDVARELNCDLEEIYDTQKRSGIIGWLKSGYQANRGKYTIIKELEKNPASYDLVIIGTPVWAGKPAVPVSTFIRDYKDELNNVAFFCTLKASGSESALQAMAELSGKTPVETMVIEEGEIKQKTCDCKVEPFVRDVVDF